MYIHVYIHTYIHTIHTIHTHYYDIMMLWRLLFAPLCSSPEKCLFTDTGMNMLFKS